MEGNRRRDSSWLPELADLTATHGYENELSRSDSGSNSNSPLTVANSKGRLYQIEDSAKDCLTAWTDEKHDLYLDHLESSFVEQLHQSIGVLAWCSEDDSASRYVSRNQHAKTRNTYEQLKTIHDDCLEKIELKRSQSVLDHGTDSLVVLKSHNRCADNQHFVRAAKLHISSAARNLCTGDVKVFFKEAGIRSKQISSRDGKSIDCIGEFSDQNFVDEDSDQMRVATMSKRSKTIISKV